MDSKPTFVSNSVVINKYLYIRDLVINNKIEILSYRSKYYIANIFTKSLKLDVFMKLKRMTKVEELSLREVDGD